MAAPPEGPALFGHPLSAAVVEVVAQRGYEEAGVEEILARAGVPRAEFDRLFTGKADAVLRVFESYIEDFKRRAGDAYRRFPTWPDNLRAAAHECLAWIEDHPHAYAFGMVRVLDAGEMVRLRREELFVWCGEMVEAGRAAAPDPEAVPAAAALIAIGAVVEIGTRHAAHDIDVDLEEVAGELMYAAVLPYLGEEAARAELTRARAGRGG